MKGIQEATVANWISALFPSKYQNSGMEAMKVTSVTRKAQDLINWFSLRGSIISTIAPTTGINVTMFSRLAISMYQNLHLFSSHCCRGA